MKKHLIDSFNSLKKEWLIRKPEKAGQAKQERTLNLGF